MVEDIVTNQPRQILARGAELGLLLVTALLLLAGFVRILPTLVRVPDSYDFAAYYVAARVLNAGNPLYNSAAMTAAATYSGQAIAFPAYIYPPFLAALLRPIANLP